MAASAAARQHRKYRAENGAKADVGIVADERGEKKPWLRRVGNDWRRQWTAGMDEKPVSGRMAPASRRAAGGNKK